MVELFTVFDRRVAINGVGSNARVAKLFGDVVGMVDIDAKGNGALPFANAKPLFNNFYDERDLKNACDRKELVEKIVEEWFRIG
ncbi:MAG: hypothetical protein AAGJ95_11670, partial [Cyanobacteria bacterium J06554_11]